MTHETAVQVSSDDESSCDGEAKPVIKEVGVTIFDPSTTSDNTKHTGARSGMLVIPMVDDLRSTPVTVEGLRPRQVIAANLLVQGWRGKDVAAALGVSAETVSRWRQQPEFQAYMHRLLQQTIDTTKLGFVSLFAESVEHLRGLVRSFDEGISLKAVALILSKVGPVLGVIGAELRQPSTQTGGPAQ